MVGFDAGWLESEPVRTGVLLMIPSLVVVEPIPAPFVLAHVLEGAALWSKSDVFRLLHGDSLVTLSELVEGDRAVADALELIAEDDPGGWMGQEQAEAWDRRLSEVEELFRFPPSPVISEVESWFPPGSPSPFAGTAGSEVISQTFQAARALLAPSGWRPGTALRLFYP